jgi:hypothetical protein
MIDYILVGSRYFFSAMEGFASKDTDYVLIEDNPKDYNYVKQLSGTFCLFKWKRMSPADYIAYALSNGPAMQVGKFLVPEFCSEIRFSIDDLKQLSPLFDRLDDAHKYEKIIYDAYISNDSFILTDSQRKTAYEEYKKYRTDKYGSAN